MCDTISMLKGSRTEARQAVMTALAAFDVASSPVGGQNLIGDLAFWRTVIREAQYQSLRAIARLDQDGEFTEGGMRPTRAVAELARSYRPDELARRAAQLIELLDQDGPAPDEREKPQVNELHLAKSRHGGGGRIIGRLDAPTFEAVARAIGANLLPTGEGEHQSLGQRQADALGDICEHAQIHHIRPWFEGGATTIDNLVMVCRAHHRMVHQSGWEIQMRHGHPQFIPPKLLDSTQKPRRKPLRQRRARTTV
jgi:hypothetical protein